MPRRAITIEMHNNRTVEHQNVDSFNLMEGFLILHKAHGAFAFPLRNIESFKAIDQRQVGS